MSQPLRSPTTSPAQRTPKLSRTQALVTRLSLLSGGSVSSHAHRRVPGHSRVPCQLFFPALHHTATQRAPRGLILDSLRGLVQQAIQVCRQAVDILLDGADLAERLVNLFFEASAPRLDALFDMPIQRLLELVPL